MFVHPHYSDSFSGIGQGNGQGNGGPGRNYNGQGSSAFSSSAQPDEDWTKISDLAERRRIQNRIAQRNYRKKLKKKLEQLERNQKENGGPTSPDSERPSSPGKGNNRRQAPKIRKTTRSSPPRQVSGSKYTPPQQEAEYAFPRGYDDRERSHTPPGLAGYYYPPPPGDEMIMAPYASLPYRPMGEVYSDYKPTSEVYPEYLTSSAGVPVTMPVTLPSLSHFSDAVKREPYSHGEEAMPYNMYNSYMPSGVDMGAGASSPYDQPMPHTPPLSHSYDHSAYGSGSDSGYEYPAPATPASPDGLPQQHPEY